MSSKKIVMVSLLIAVCVAQGGAAQPSRFSRLKSILTPVKKPFTNIAEKARANYEMYKKSSTPEEELPQGKLRPGLNKFTSGLAAGFKTIIPERILPQSFNRKLYTDDVLNPTSVIGGQGGAEGNANAQVDFEVPGWQYSGSGLQRGLSSIGSGLRSVGSKLSNVGRRIMPRRKVVETRFSGSADVNLDENDAKGQLYRNGDTVPMQNNPLYRADTSDMSKPDGSQPASQASTDDKQIPLISVFNEKGQRIDAMNGRLVPPPIPPRPKFNEQGQLINDKGQPINKEGQRIDAMNGRLVPPPIPPRPGSRPGSAASSQKSPEPELLNVESSTVPTSAVSRFMDIDGVRVPMRRKSVQNYHVDSDIPDFENYTDLFDVIDNNTSSKRSNVQGQLVNPKIKPLPNPKPANLKQAGSSANTVNKGFVKDIAKKFNILSGSNQIEG